MEYNILVKKSTVCSLQVSHTGFCVLDSQRTAVKTSKLAPPKNFYLFMIFTNIKNRCYNYKRRTTRKTKVFVREKFSQIFTDVFTITKVFAQAAQARDVTLAFERLQRCDLQGFVWGGTVLKELLNFTSEENC